MLLKHTTRRLKKSVSFVNKKNRGLLTELEGLFINNISISLVICFPIFIQNLNWDPQRFILEL